MRSVRAVDLRSAGAVLVVAAAALGMLLLVVARPEGGVAYGSGSAAAAQPAGEVLATGPIRPARLSIPAIGVDAPVESRGTVRYENPFTGERVDGYGVPEEMGTTSWWSDGPEPGSGAMAVVLGHQGAPGGAVFDRLHTLEAGDEVSFRDDGGALLRLQVLGAPVTGLDKATSALAETLNGHPAEADVALVTCGGEYDDDAGASTENTVVFATVAR